MSITVLLVDDHPVLRTGLRAVLSAQPDIEVVGEASTGEEAIVVTRTLQPQVVLCDLRLGEGIDGIETTAALRALPDPPVVIIVTTFDRGPEILGAIEAGAAGYLMKDTAPEAIAESVRVAAAGGTVLAPELATKMVSGLRTNTPKLTGRETDVLQRLAQGSSNKEIAQQLFVSEATVKSHLVHIFEKLNADSRSRAIHLAREHGLI